MLRISVVLDVTATLAFNKSGEPEWADVHQVIEVANKILSSSHLRCEAEKDHELCWRP